MPVLQWLALAGNGCLLSNRVRSPGHPHSSMSTPAPRIPAAPHAHPPPPLPRAPLPVATDGQQAEVLPALVADQGLVEAALALQDVDGGVQHAVLQPEQQIQVAQANVRVQQGHLVTEPGGAGEAMGRPVAGPRLRAGAGSTAAGCSTCWAHARSCLMRGDRSMKLRPCRPAGAPAIPTHPLPAPGRLLGTHRAMDMPRLAVLVVLPTPPLPEVTTITRASAGSPPSSPSLNATGLRAGQVGRAGCAAGQAVIRAAAGGHRPGVVTPLRVCPTACTTRRGLAAVTMPRAGACSGHSIQGTRWAVPHHPPQAAPRRRRCARKQLSAGDDVRLRQTLRGRAHAVGWQICGRLSGQWRRGSR
jgi:hypothetical protein